VNSHLRRVFLLVLSIVMILLSSTAEASCRTVRSSVVRPSAPVSGPCVITSRGAPSAGCGLACVYDKSGSLLAAFSVGEHTVLISPGIQPDAGGRESTKLSTLPYGAPSLLRETRTVKATKPGVSTAADIESTMQGLPKGKSGAVRVVATDAELQSTFDAMSKGGKPITRPGYNGPVVELPDGTQIGLRGASKSGGRTIDIKYPSGTDGKVHIG
jgi:hypothetical protein